MSDWDDACAKFDDPEVQAEYEPVKEHIEPVGDACEICGKVNSTVRKCCTDPDNQNLCDLCMTSEGKRDIRRHPHYTDPNTGRKRPLTGPEKAQLHRNYVEAARTRTHANGGNL